MRIVASFMLIIGCILMNACVQKTHRKTIHFKLNVAELPNPKKVGVRGEFGSNSWEDTFYLTYNNHDDIYEGTITKMTGQGGMDFKFIINENEYELEGQGNRWISFKYQPETIYYEAIFNNVKANIIIE